MQIPVANRRSFCCCNWSRDLLSSLESLFCVFSSSTKILVRSPRTLWAIIVSRIVPCVIALQDLAVRKFVFLCSSCNKPGISRTLKSVRMFWICTICTTLLQARARRSGENRVCILLQLLFFFFSVEMFLLSAYG
jgi:hypothetical protein